MNLMEYKGYTAKIDYSNDDECFIGHIDSIVDIIGFHGESVKELKEAFIEAVDDYIDFCVSIGKKPQKVLSENLMLRIASEVRETLEKAAGMSGKNLNQWATDALCKEARILCA